MNRAPAYEVTATNTPFLTYPVTRCLPHDIDILDLATVHQLTGDVSGVATWGPETGRFTQHFEFHP